MSESSLTERNFQSCAGGGQRSDIFIYTTIKFTNHDKKIEKIERNVGINVYRNIRNHFGRFYGRIRLQRISEKSVADGSDRGVSGRGSHTYLRSHIFAAVRSDVDPLRWRRATRRVRRPIFRGRHADQGELVGRDPGRYERFRVAGTRFHRAVWTYDRVRERACRHPSYVHQSEKVD